MTARDDLQFQEFEDATSLLASSPGATTVSIEDDVGPPPRNQRPQQQPTRVAERGGGESDDDDEEVDMLGRLGDKTELLSEEKKSAPFWTFDYYKTFFDVDTHQVLDRIKGSMIPFPGRSFVRKHIRGNPDLYGPFWICATLVFAISISGNLSNLFTQGSGSEYHYVADFRKVSIAATAIYSYAWLVPLAMWGFLLWRSNRTMGVMSFSFLEIVCAYGYSLFIYIPTAVLWTIPSGVLQWILIVVAMALSGSVLALTFWPAFRDDDKRIAVATTVVIFLLNTLLAVGCKLYFFSTRQAHIAAVTTLSPHVTMAHRANGTAH